MVVTGARVIAEALKAQGVKYIFGVSGRFALKIIDAAQEIGINYIGTRCEQSACYAASAMGCFTQRPGVCLSVGGPGFLNTISGMANATANCWPLIVLSNSFDVNEEHMGSFQEFPQVDAAKPYCKFAAKPSSVSRIGFLMEKAFRTSMYGRPGVSYLDFPSNLITEQVDVMPSLPSRCADPPRSSADPTDISQAVETIRRAQKPLIIIGKGAGYAMAGDAILKLVNLTNIPFLTTPMGKGVVPDDHPQCVTAARSDALLNADVILVLGARLNWILHFGKPPIFSKDVKIVQVDICAVELGNNVRSEVSLLGDLPLVVDQLNNEISSRYHENAEQQTCGSRDWLSQLKAEAKKNINYTEERVRRDSFPMSYRQVYGQIREFLPRDCIVINEAGLYSARICRTVIPSFLPMQRFDLGSFGTVGAGIGFAIAAALHAESEAKEGDSVQRVVCIQGDSSFGFYGMDVETAVRYNLPIVFIVINNNGIGIGFNRWDGMDDPGIQFPSTALSPNIRYEKMMDAFGCMGYFAETKEKLRDVLTKAFHETKNKKKPVLINVMIDTTWSGELE